MSDDNELHERFEEQAAGRAKHVWPNGQLGPDDDGELLIRLACDPATKTIIIDFGKAVKWMGLDLSSAVSLRDSLDQRIKELRSLS